ncbi:hypothetical protein SAMN05216436_12147 [bacterium A37T11]|nr:hypothetical protein SAMN05216436_12147 [bacterium A37T11]
MGVDPDGRYSIWEAIGKWVGSGFKGGIGYRSGHEDTGGYYVGHNEVFTDADGVGGVSYQMDFGIDKAGQAIQNQLNTSYKIGEYNPSTGRITGSGAIDPSYVEFEIALTAYTAGAYLEERMAPSAVAEVGGRVFWSGEGALDDEMNYAKSTGGTTLEMTRAGQNLQKLIQTKNIPWSEARPMWKRLSTKFAQGADGAVHFFPGKSVRPTSIWLETERPILLNNGVNIITH